MVTVPKHPGETNDNPMCINMYCPSAFSCYRFASEPYQGESGTISIDPAPDMLGGLLCASFYPLDPHPTRAMSPSLPQTEGDA